MKRFILLSVLALAATPQPARAGWTRTYGGEDYESGLCVLPATDNSYVVLGNSTSYHGIWLLKVAEDGDTLWTKVYEGRGYCIDSTVNKGYIITGQRNDSLLLQKVDSKGNLLWSRTYREQLTEDEESVDDVGYGLCSASDGGYIVTGELGRQDTSLEMDYNLYLLKTDAEGNKEWSQIFGYFDWAVYDWGRSICEASDGGYVVCGTCEGWLGYNYAKLWWFKTDSSGSILWERTYEEGYANYGKCIRQTSDGGYIITGYVDDDLTMKLYLVLIKTDSHGKIEWQQSYGKEGARGSWVEQTSDGGYIITGSCTFRGGR